MDRRGFLGAGATLAAVAAVGLAGCTGDGGATTPESPNEGATPTRASATLETHPAGSALATQPTLGPEPGEAAGTIVAFEDPSCPTCARFEREVVPQLRAELVEPGTVSLVFRGYPVIYDWGEPATRALEAVYDADPAAHWTLAEYYFGNQDAFVGADAPTVYDRTAEALAAQTDLDAASIIDGARAGDFDAAVRTDLDAGQAAGAGRTTPHLFFFREGTFQTKSAGYTGMATIRNVLQV